MDGSGRINACSNNFRRKNSAGYRTVLFGISQVRHMGSTIMIDAVTSRIEQEGISLERKHFKYLGLHVTFKG
jgi:hypothetical protein